MRQAVFTGIGGLEIQDVPVPKPGPREVLVQVAACGICGTDRSFFVGHRVVTPPLVLGHEYGGTVVECGPGVSSLRVGDRVVADPNIACGLCSHCRRGAVNLCQRMTTLGITIQGGYAEYSAMPETNAYPIPDGLSFEEAALTEPLACGVRGITRAEVALGDVVVVLGAGPLGLLLMQLARIRGASRVIITSSDPDRRELAVRLGADEALDTKDPEAVRRAILERTEGHGADVVVDASGITATVQRGLDLVRIGGTMLLFGCCPREDHLSVPALWAQEKELTIRGTYVNPFTHATAVKLLASGRVRAKELISDHISLDELGATLRSGAMTLGRVLVHPGGVA